MEISKKLTIGQDEYIITGQGKNFTEASLDLAKVASLYDIKECGLCKSEWLRLYAYVTKDGNSYEYAKITCGKCRGSLNISEAKSDGSRYYQRGEDKKLNWVAYEGKEETKETKDSKGNTVVWDE